MNLKQLFDRKEAAEKRLAFQAQASHWLRNRSAEELPAIIRKVQSWEKEGKLDPEDVEKFLNWVATLAPLDARALSLLITRDRKYIPALFNNTNLDEQNVAWLQQTAAEWLIENDYERLMQQTGDDYDKGAEILLRCVEKGYPLETEIRQQLIQQYLSRQDPPPTQIVEKILKSPSFTTEELLELIPRVEIEKNLDIARILVGHPQADQEVAMGVLQRFAATNRQGYFFTLLSAIADGGKKGRNRQSLYAVVIEKARSPEALEDLLGQVQLQDELPERALQRWAHLDSQHLADKLQNDPPWLEQISTEDLLPLLAWGNPELRKIVSRLIGRHPSLGSGEQQKHVR